MQDEKFYLEKSFPPQWLGGWESVNGNPDVYIFQDMKCRYQLLAYCYDPDYGRGSFTPYVIEGDRAGWYIGVGMKRYHLSIGSSPNSLCIGTWGEYMSN